MGKRKTEIRQEISYKQKRSRWSIMLEQATRKEDSDRREALKARHEEWTRLATK